MSKSIKCIDGFKFSFKDANESSKSTPKFTSIELQSNQLDYLRSKQKSIKQFRIAQKNKIQQNTNAKIVKKYPHRAKINSVPIAQQTFGNLQDLQQKNFTLVNPRKKQFHRKIAYSTPIIPINRINQVGGKFKQRTILKIQTSQKKTISKSLNKLNNNSQEKNQNSYLQIFKKQKQQRLAKEKDKSLSNSFKNHLNLQDIIIDKQIKLDIPKITFSVQSAKNIQKKTQTIQTQFITKYDQIQLINQSIFPQTEKSKKFLSQETDNYNSTSHQSIFHRFKKHQNKRNQILSKALFKNKKKKIADQTSLLINFTNQSIQNQK